MVRPYSIISTSAPHWGQTLALTPPFPMTGCISAPQQKHCPVVISSRAESCSPPDASWVGREISTTIFAVRLISQPSSSTLLLCRGSAGFDSRQAPSPHSPAANERGHLL